MARYRDGQKIPTQIWEAAAMHHPVKVGCTILDCGNIGIFDPQALWWFFYKRHWSDTFSVAQHRFYCQRCSGLAGFRVKRAMMEPMKTGAPNRSMTLPPEREWKRFLSRQRG